MVASPSGEAAPLKDKAIVRMDGMVYFFSDIDNMARSLAWMSCQNSGKVGAEVQRVWDNVGLSRDWWKKDWIKNPQTLQNNPQLVNLSHFLKILHFYRLQGFLAKPFKFDVRKGCQNLWSEKLRQSSTEIQNLELFLVQKSSGRSSGSSDSIIPIDRIIDSIKHEFFN